MAGLDDEGERRGLRARRPGEVIPGIEARQLPGFLAIDLIRREREGDVEFVTMMWFDSLDAVKAFMGQDYAVAHVPDAARAVLSGYDERSVHYEVLERRRQPRPGRA